MKTNAFLYIALAAALALTACGGGDDPDEPTPLPPTPTQPKGKHLTQQCDMPADASEITIRLQGLSSEVSRKSGSASWLTTSLVPDTSGTPEVTVACTQNLTTATRSQEVTFIATNDTLVLNVRQAVYAGGTDVNNPSDTPTDQPAYSRGI